MTTNHDHALALAQRAEADAHPFKAEYANAQERVAAWDAAHRCATKHVPELAQALRRVVGERDDARASLMEEWAKGDKYADWVARLTRERDAARGAIRNMNYGNRYECEWCGVEHGKPHAADCQRQAALGETP